MEEGRREGGREGGREGLKNEARRKEGEYCEGVHKHLFFRGALMV